MTQERIDNLKKECIEIEEKWLKLKRFLTQERPNDVTSTQWFLLHEQEAYMKGYYLTLIERIGNATQEKIAIN